MPLKAYWAYDFACNHALEPLQGVLNDAGPWPWQLRDSAWYGDYLNTRPADGVRVRIHAYPQYGAGGTFTGLREEGFSALLQINTGSPATQDEIDTAFRRLLTTAGAYGLTPIEPYD